MMNKINEMCWMLRRNNVLTNDMKMRIAFRMKIKPYIVQEIVTTGYGLCDMYGYTIDHGEYDSVKEATTALKKVTHGYSNSHTCSYGEVYNRVTGDTIKDNSTGRDWRGARY